MGAAGSDNRVILGMDCLEHPWYIEDLLGRDIGDSGVPKHHTFGCQTLQHNLVAASHALPV